jgi:FkbM family methyltransferase
MFSKPRRKGDFALRGLLRVNLNESDIAVDCGANVGEITDHLRKSGTTVFAFEPNPFAFDVLQRRFENSHNVYCINKGVFHRNGTMRFYFHKLSDQDEVKWSKSSSLLEFKGNVNPKKHIAVEVIDLCSFLQDLKRPVKLLKMDIEGVEPMVLKHLICTGLIKNIEHVFVETHDHKIPQIKVATNEVRAMLMSNGCSNVNLDWP